MGVFINKFFRTIILLLNGYSLFCCPRCSKKKNVSSYEEKRKMRFNNGHMEVLSSIDAKMFNFNNDISSAVKKSKYFEEFSKVVRDNVEADEKLYDVTGSGEKVLNYGKVRDSINSNIGSTVKDLYNRVRDIAPSKVIVKKGKKEDGSDDNIALDTLILGIRTGKIEGKIPDNINELINVICGSYRTNDSITKKVCDAVLMIKLKEIDVVTELTNILLSNINLMKFLLNNNIVIDLSRENIRKLVCEVSSNIEDCVSADCAIDLISEIFKCVDTDITKGSEMLNFNFDECVVFELNGCIKSFSDCALTIRKINKKGENIPIGEDGNMDIVVKFSEDGCVPKILNILYEIVFNNYLFPETNCKMVVNLSKKKVMLPVCNISLDDMKKKIFDRFKNIDSKDTCFGEKIILNDKDCAISSDDIVKKINSVIKDGGISSIKQCLDIVRNAVSKVVKDHDKDTVINKVKTDITNLMNGSGFVKCFDVNNITEYVKREINNNKDEVYTNDSDTVACVFDSVITNENVSLDKVSEEIERFLELVKDKELKSFYDYYLKISGFVGGLLLKNEHKSLLEGMSNGQKCLEIIEFGKKFIGAKKPKGFFGKIWGFLGS